MPRINLQGSSSIITGGASGIGEASARLLAAAGSKVVIADLNAGRGEAVASELGGVFVRCDVSKVEDAKAAVAAATALGPLRALVNSAGLGLGARTVDRNGEPLDLEKFSFIIKVNLIGSFNMLSQAAAAMAKTEPLDADGSRGAIVNIASVSAVRPSPGTAAYGAAKAGLVSLTQSLAIEWAPKVRVNAIIAGLIATEHAADHYGGENGLADVAATVPLSRMGDPGDIADACRFLASPLASYASGSSITLHGGGERPAFLAAARSADPPLA